MVSGVVAHADEFLGQEVMSMTPQRLYAALHDVRQQIAPIITVTPRFPNIKISLKR